MKNLWTAANCNVIAEFYIVMHYITTNWKNAVIVIIVTCNFGTRRTQQWY